MSHETRCKHCQSESCTVFPADVRVYLNGARTVSAPPINPAPTITMCLECGWSEFSASASWLAARWLKPIKPQTYVPTYGAYSGD